MRAKQQYSEAFRDAIVSKIVSRGSLSIAEVCRREGVGLPAANNWLRARASVGAMIKPKTWTAEAKLKAIVESSSLSEEEMGLFLRREGLYASELKEWRDEAMKGLAPLGRRPGVKKDDRDQKIKSLERDLRRKDSALAEASALLILQKKIDQIWGTKKGDDE